MTAKQRKTTASVAPPLPLLTVDDVCQVLRIDRSTWDDWRGRNYGPQCIKISPKAVRVHPDDLAAFIESCRESKAS